MLRRFVSFPISYYYLPILKIYILYPQTQTLHQTHPTAVQQTGNQMVNAIQVSQDNPGNSTGDRRPYRDDATKYQQVFTGQGLNC